MDYLEQAKTLVGVSIFDTVRNVYYTLVLNKELGAKPFDLANSIHQIKHLEVSDKRFAKLLFEALIDCSSLEEQLTLIVFLFKYYSETKDALVSLAHATNDLDNGIH